MEKDRTEAVVEAVYSAVADSIQALNIPPVEPPKKDRRTKGEEIAVLLQSDWQLGKRTPTYSSEVCEARIALLREKVDRLVVILRADHPVKRICLRSEEHTSELQSRENRVCRLLLEKKNIVL